MKYVLILKSEKLSILKNYIYFFRSLVKPLNLKLTILGQPSKKHIFSLLKSPHVNKKSKEHYGITYFSCVVIFYNFHNIYLIKKIMKNKPLELNCKFICQG